MAYVWIIEILDKGKWYPTIGCGLTKKTADMFKRAEWEAGCSKTKFRVVKYERKEKSCPYV